MDEYQKLLQRQRQHILDATRQGKEAEKLQQLLDQIIDYQLRVRDYPFPTAPSTFSEQLVLQITPVSFELAAEIDYRLGLLSSYQLSDPSRVRQLILAGLQIMQPPVLTQLQTNVLTRMHHDPMIGTVSLAKTLGVSPRTINSEKDQLFTQFGVRIASAFDPHQFELLHLGIRIRTKSPKASHELEVLFHQEAASEGSLPFLLGTSFDMNQQDGFISLYLPNQVQARTQFDQFVRKISDEFLEEFEVFQIHGFFTNMSFASYDHVSQEWQVISDLRTEGTKRFIEEYGPQFPPPRGFSYKQSTLRFNQTDWILTLGICEGLLERSERLELLKTNGFTMADKTAWAHENRLRKAQAHFPYLTFGRLFFDEIICVLVKCEPTTLDFLQQFITQFVMGQLFPTENGAIVYIGTLGWAPSLTNQLTHTLLEVPGLNDVTVLRLKRELPHVPAIHTYRLWNPKTKQWTLPKGHLG